MSRQSDLEAMPEAKRESPGSEASSAGSAQPGGAFILPSLIGSRAVGPEAKLVYITMLGVTGNGPACSSSDEELAGRLRMKAAAVAKSMTGLERAGFIRIEPAAPGRTIHLLCEAAEVAAQRTHRAGGVARGHSPSNGGLA